MTMDAGKDHFGLTRYDDSCESRLQRIGDHGKVCDIQDQSPHDFALVQAGVSQSDHLNRSLFAQILAPTNMVVRISITDATAIVAVDNDSGLVKLGGSPLGFFAAGMVQGSTPGGSWKAILSTNQ
jgi:hypothetical protein